MTESSYLVDANVWLERLLGQEKSEEVGRFLDMVPTDRMCLTDFAFHSVSLIMVRLGKKEGLLIFVRDAFIDGALTIVHLEPVDMQNLVRAMEHFRLDFDDAYSVVSRNQLYNGLKPKNRRDIVKAISGHYTSTWQRKSST